MLEILGFLWQAGCNMNVRVNEYSPLLTACRFGSNRSIAFLLESCNIRQFPHGSDPFIVGQAGTMAHHFCAHDGNLQMLRLLIEKEGLDP